jgi:hypothetical protein
MLPMDEDKAREIRQAIDDVWRASVESQPIINAALLERFIMPIVEATSSLEEASAALQALLDNAEGELGELSEPGQDTADWLRVRLFELLRSTYPSGA